MPSRPVSLSEINLNIADIASFAWRAILLDDFAPVLVFRCEAFTGLSFWRF